MAGMTRPGPTGYNRGMDPRFKQDESLAAGTQRILEMKLVAALEHLQSPPERRDEGIHECRKCLKYARALLRLVGEGMPKAAFRRWNVTLRNAARCISGLRDATALLECLDTLAAEFGGVDAASCRVPAAPGLAPKTKEAGSLFYESATSCREALAGRGAAGPASGPVSADAAVEKASLLISGMLTTPHDPGLGRGREARILGAGLRRSYKRGRRAMKCMLKTGDVQAAHEWRKRAKDLRYQVAMLRDVWPGVCNALEGELHRLTDLLGQIHDLDLVEKALAALPSGPVADKALNPVRGRAKQSAETAAAEARRLGARLYGDTPEEFVEKVTRWWRLWRSEPCRANGTAQQDSEGKKHD